MEAKLLKQLLDILKKEYNYYQKLCDLAEAKKEALIENDIEELAGLVENDNQILEEVQQLEEKRNNIIRQLSLDLGLKEEIKLNNLLEKIPDSYQKQLQDIKNKLLDIIEKFHQINQQNRVLLDEAMDLNKISFNMMANIVEIDTQIYDNRKNKKSDSKVEHILDHRA